MVVIIVIHVSCMYWKSCSLVENDIPIHREEYLDPIFHGYQGGDSCGDGDDGSFISIPDESHTPFVPYTPSPPCKPSKEKRKKQKDAKTGSKHCAQAEVYELTEQPRSLTPEIAYHNDAYVSDVEVELDLDCAPSSTRVGGFNRKSRSKTRKAQNAFQNDAYEDERENCQQTNL